MRWLSILVVALALVAAGCGGGDDESAASDETTVEETLTTGETTTEDAGTDTDADFNFADEDCRSLVAAFVAVGSAFSSAAGGTDELADQAEAFAQFADDVPEEIRADVQTLADAYGQYVEVIQDAGIEPGQIPTAEQAQQLQDALASVGTADVSAASERLSAWTNENCS
jgi:ABC-type Zn uptake system ZnuABC Zn-binding protein ZnuA